MSEGGHVSVYVNVRYTKELVELPLVDAGLVMLLSCLAWFQPLLLYS